jgi:hypothetical protein
MSTLGNDVSREDQKECMDKRGTCSNSHVGLSKKLEMIPVPMLHAAVISTPDRPSFVFNEAVLAGNQTLWVEKLCPQSSM